MTLRRPGGQARILLIGDRQSGREALVNALSDGGYKPRVALAVEYFGRFALAPSEFIEHRRFYRPLITSSQECDMLFFVHDAARRYCQIPPGFARMFNRRVVGVMTGIEKEDANLDRARRILLNTGVREIWEVNLTDSQSLAEVQHRLELLDKDFQNDAKDSDRTGRK